MMFVLSFEKIHFPRFSIKLRFQITLSSKFNVIQLFLQNKGQYLPSTWAHIIHKHRKKLLAEEN
jgi:hypothetical protein